MKKVLFYSPYGSWDLHTAYELTIAHGLRHRGAQTTFLCCDGIYSDCDVAWKVVNPRTPDTCKKCIQCTLDIFKNMQMEMHWISRFLTKDIVDSVRAWEQSVPKETLFKSIYKERPLGDWVKSSVHSHFRSKELNINDPEVEAGFRSYLFSGCLAFEALSRALDEFQPDIVTMLNGRFFTHRVCHELAKERNIKLINHERGFIDHSLSFWINETAHDYEKICQRCTEWEDIPLTSDQLQQIHEIMMDREHGKTATWHKKVTDVWADSTANVIEQLKLDPNKRIISLYTSSEDETANVKKELHLITQKDWIKETLDVFKDRPDLQLVIRVHPNTTGITGTAQEFLDFLEEIVAAGIPENVRIVAPTDKVNSYHLLAASDRILVYMSTIIMESPIRGVPSMTNTEGYFLDRRFTTSLRPGEPFASQLLDFLDTRFSQQELREHMRDAYRHAYSMLLRSSFPFPLITVEGVHRVQANFQNTDDLKPGKDEMLDAICDLYIKDIPLHKQPGQDDLSRSLEAENLFIENRFKELGLQ